VLPNWLNVAEMVMMLPPPLRAMRAAVAPGQ
jgi:hypothetical protein